MKLQTKKDFQDLLMQWLDPLKMCYSEGGAYVCPGSTSAWYEDVSAYMEGFTRPLWGLVPFWYGGGYDKGFEELYLKGLANGVNPASGEYWGECVDREQRIVEMTAIAYGLLFSPEKLWDPLSEDDKSKVAEWLYQINEHIVCDSNWRWFRVMVNIALKKLGVKYSAEKLDTDLERIEDFYIGNGWYKDGTRNLKDYYVSFAFHFYGLIYSMVEKEDKRSNKYRERAELFAKDFIYWFDDDGEALPYGRSLIYRFAQISFWGICLVSGIKPFSVGVMKGIIVRHLEKWIRSDMLDKSGLLTIGYKYQNYYMAEYYNSPSSPYWAMKAFSFLMLPNEHEFWNTKPEPMPKLESLKILKEADMLIARYNGHVTAYPCGYLRTNDDTQKICKYSKFAYSTKFGFNVSRGNFSLGECSCDNMLVFVYEGLVLMRRYTDTFEIKESKLIIKWSPIKGINVETEIIPNEYGHERRHRIISEFACEAYDCGFAVACRDTDDYEIGEGYVKNKFSYCGVKSDKGTPIISTNAPNTNLFYQQTKIPAVKYDIKVGENIVATNVLEVEND